MTALASQTGMELRLTLRRGESLVVTLAIPLLVLGFIPQDVQFLVPGVLALSVVATSMVSFAISTAYDRSYGVLKLLGGSPLGRGRLIGAKLLSILAIQAVQVGCVAGLGLALGWDPVPSGVPAAVVVIVVGSAAFTGLGMLMAGTLRAEATLAVSNLLFVLFIPFGGVVLPVESMPTAVADIAKLLPITAFSEALRLAFGGLPAVTSAPFALLVVWAVALVTAAVRTFKWE